MGTKSRPRRAQRASTVLVMAWTLGCGGPLQHPSPAAPRTAEAAHEHEHEHATVSEPLGSQLRGSEPLALDPRLRWVLDPGAFEPLPPPRPGSWRDRVHEPSQSFAELAGSRFNRPQPGRNTLVLLPLGSFPTELVVEGDDMHTVHTPELRELRGFASAYFGLPVDVVTPIPIEPLDIPTHEHHGHARYDALGLIDAVAPALPEHAHAMIVLINRDLLAGPERSYGFGYATHTERLAVMSFARIDPRRTGSAPGTDVDELTHARAYKLLAHELAHTFGLRHCDRFACVMNGIADELELDQTPLHLCPECLHKLLYVSGVDPEARYRALAAWYAEQGLDDEARWVGQRLTALEKAEVVALTAPR